MPEDLVSNRKALRGYYLGCFGNITGLEIAVPRMELGTWAPSRTTKSRGQAVI